MADRYWVGGAGTWDASTTTNWSATSGGAGGASAPTSADNVIFDANSNTGTDAFTVTIGGTPASPSVCNDFTTGGGGGALDGVMTLGSSLGTERLEVYGSLTFPATNLTVTGINGSKVSFKSTTTGKTLTTNGVSFINSDVDFDGVGGGWTLGSALAISSGGGLNVLNGTFNTGNYNMTIGSLSATGTATRTMTLGSSTITCTASVVCNFSSTGLTFNANTSQITGSATSPTFTGGGLTYYNVSFTSVASGTTTITGANTFNNLTQTSRSATGIRIVSLGDNQTVSGALTLGVANTAIRRMQVQSSVIGTQRTITCNGTLAAIADVDFRDINAAGTVATPWTGTRIGNCLGNSNITFTAAADKYWNLAAGGSWGSNGWALSSGGAVAANNFPLAQDKVIIENTGLNTSATITMDQAWQIGELNTSTRSNAMNFAWGNSDPIIYKNFVISSSVTFTTTSGSPSITFAGQGTTQNITTNGVNIGMNQIFIDSPSGTVKLLDNLSVNISGSSLTSGTMLLTQGTLDLNDFDLTCVFFSSTNSNIRTIDFGTGEINVTGNNASVLSMGTATNFTYSGTPIFNFTYSGSTGTRAIAFGSAAGHTESNVPNINITAGTDIVSTSASRYKNLNFTGFSGTLTNNTRGIFGNLTISTGMSLDAGTLITAFASTSGTQEITTNGKTLDFPISAGAVGGTVEFKDALTMGSTKLLALNPSTIKFKNGTTNSVGNLVIAGTVSNQVVIQSTSPGNTYTLSATSGPVNAYYATITDCVASPITLGTQLLGNMAYSGLSFSVAAQDTTSEGLFFKDDGTKMYVAGTTNDFIYQYSISKPWNPSTATYDGVSFSVAAQDTSSEGIFFKPDGTKMYMLGEQTNSVFQYSLSTPWDLSTASYDSVSFSFTTQDTEMNSFFFKPDGTKMYVAGYQNDSVYQYSLSTPWDISTATYDSISFSITAQDTNPEGMFFTSDGTKMFISGSINDFVFQYSLSTPWDLSTATYDSLSFYVGSQDSSPRQIYLKEGSSYILYLIGNATDTVYQYNLGNKFNAFRGAGNIYSYGNINGGNNKGITFTPPGTQLIPFF